MSNLTNNGNMGEIYKENIRLNKRLKRQTNDETDSDDEQVNGRESVCPCFRPLKEMRKNCKNFLLILLLFSLAIASGMLVVAYHPYIYPTKALGKLSANKPLEISLSQRSIAGHRQDKDIQDCNGGQLKKTFPDLDYALFGYNIMKGYPLAVGHDPGFTHPIFQQDYSERKQTADCRYSVPTGFILAPDVSCVTSFTSKVIQDSSQFSKALSVSAEISGGGWGVSFSASTDFKKKTSEMSSQETVYILSTAKCDYYFAILDEVQPPSLSESFIKKARMLVTEKDIFEFFEYYGTHFVKYILFGAKFIYEHKMSKRSFKKESSDSLSVSAKASYSGLFSMSGGFGMTQEQRSAAQSFQKQVETSIISIGAPPPANGDTLTWASQVKDTPVPVKYTLVSIEDLFSEKYMKDTGINYADLGQRIKDAKSKFCMKLQKEGVVDSCKMVESYKESDELRLGNTYYKEKKAAFELCVSSCLDESQCVAVTHHYQESKCSLYGARMDHVAISDQHSKLVLFIDNMKMLDKNLKIKNARIQGQSREGSGHVGEEFQCGKKCHEDNRVCIAYTFRQAKQKNCLLYQQSSINDNSIKFDQNSSVVIQTNYDLISNSTSHT